MTSSSSDGEREPIEQVETERLRAFVAFSLSAKARQRGEIARSRQHDERRHRMAADGKETSDKIRKRASGGAHHMTAREAREASKRARIMRPKKR